MPEFASRDEDDRENAQGAPDHSVTVAKTDLHWAASEGVSASRGT